MRDPERVSKVLAVIEDIWRLYPDTRFLQLLHNLQMEFHNDTGNGHYFSDNAKGSAYDMFYVEDDEFLQWLEEYRDRLK